MKHLFIVNPIAGGKDSTAEVTEKVKAAFKNRSDEYEIYVTKAPMDAAEKIRSEAASEEHIRAYSCGGDGTFNECVCGAAGLKNVAVCPLPTGTGNDFCRMFGDEKGLFNDIDAVLDGWEHPIDVIDCNGRKSVNICSVGIDARIGTGVHKYSKMKLVGGATAYVVSAAVEMFKGIARPMKVTCGDYSAFAPHSLICACNGRYYGGGFNPSRDAMPDDGVLDIFVVRKVNLIQFALLIGKYAGGKADEMKKLITHLRGDSITIEFDEESVVNLDGEAMFTKKAVMKLEPASLNLVVPKGMKFFDA